MYGVRCNVYGVFSMVYGVLCMVYGVLCIVYGVLCIVYWTDHKYINTSRCCGGSFRGLSVPLLSRAGPSVVLIIQRMRLKDSMIGVYGIGE
jgi:hypothetical protein